MLRFYFRLINTIYLKKSESNLNLLRASSSILLHENGFRVVIPLHNYYKYVENPQNRYTGNITITSKALYTIYQAEKWSFHIIDSQILFWTSYGFLLFPYFCKCINCPSQYFCNFIFVAII